MPTLRPYVEPIQASIFQNSTYLPDSARMDWHWREMDSDVYNHSFDLSLKLFITIRIVFVEIKDRTRRKVSKRSDYGTTTWKAILDEGLQQRQHNHLIEGD